MIKRIAALIMAFVLFGCSIPAVSAQLFPPASSEGSIKVFLEWENEKLDNGALTAYRVYDIVKTNGDYYFEPVQELKKYNLDLMNMIEPQQVKELVRLAKAEKLRKFTAPIENGEAFFGNLPMGLYVVLQEAGDATSGYEPISPFLIPVPNFADGGYDLHVLAYPKVSPAPEGTEPPGTEPPGTEPSETKPTEPSKPKDPTLPQSGQLNWPVPVLAVSGVLLILIGALILSGGRKDSYEK